MLRESTDQQVPVLNTDMLRPWRSKLRRAQSNSHRFG